MITALRGLGGDVAVLQPKAIPTVAAVGAGASLIVTQEHSVPRRVSSDQFQPAPGLWPAYLPDADLVGQVTDFRFAVAGHEHQPAEGGARLGEGG